jgi:glucan 1,3-beta-glucosidase
MYLKGVNLGGWLVLERWLSRSLFDHYNAKSEPELYNNLKNNFSELTKHYENYVNEGDFIYLKEHGINSIRLPISYGVFGDFKPIPQTIKYVDFAMEYARKHNIQVLLDLHSVPGGQNGWEVGGKQGSFSWHTDKQNINSTLKIISQIAKRYKKYENLYGIELVNEPNPKIPLSVLKKFYIEGYKAIREHCSAGVAVVISDSFRPKEWNHFMVGPNYSNVVLDMHMYQCFAQHEKKLTMLEHFNLTCVDWVNLISHVQQNRSAICGEWSLALDNQSFEWLTPEEKRLAIKDYGKVQLETFEDLSGWFYWTYKLPYASAWNFRHCIESNLLTI